MAIDDSEDEAPPPQGTASPALQEFPDAFTHPAAKEWASEAATRLNDYFQRRQIAENAAAAGQDFVNNIDQFKSGLVNMVQSDPHAVHVALDLVAPTMSALINGMPNAPENPDEHHAALTGHMQSEIAAAAVTSAAESHEGVARALLGNERIRSVLGDAAGPLGVYTDMQAAARQRDQEADAGQARAAQVEIADNSARNYIGALVDPNNGKPRSPPGWNQAVMADNKVPPQMKVDLFDVHERLGVTGDAETDPLAVTRLISQMARGQFDARDVYGMIGTNLSLSDASWLLDKAKANTSDKSALKQVDMTLQAAQRQLAPNNDVAEIRAYGRFASWFFDEIKKGGDIDPRSPNSIWPEGHASEALWQSFKVNGDDLLGEASPGTFYVPGGARARLGLGEIFGNTNKQFRPIAPPREAVHPSMGDNPGNPDLTDENDQPAEPHYHTPEIHAGNAPLQPLPMIPELTKQPIGTTGSEGFFQRRLQENPNQPNQSNPLNKGTLS